MHLLQLKEKEKFVKASCRGKTTSPKSTYASATSNQRLIEMERKTHCPSREANDTFKLEG
jgi:hypothetical protein